ncbi:hypothetical protein ABT330_33575 [Streptomyces sp. NPDC000658]|uniref:hypothetical protein n=1 Tax=Streptomyces sp. NPDC000658 TaxID=3154266 RepID=UPI00333109B3
MRNFLRVAAAVALTSILTGCGGDGKDETQGTAGKDVCDHFAAASDVADALSFVGNTENFTEVGSKPKETLASLRSADGKVDDTQELQGSPYCSLKAADGEERILTIYFREAATVDEADSEAEKTFTFYNTGASAMGTDRLASIYFRCPMKSPNKTIIVNGTLERENKVEASGKEVAAKQMTVMNAAALKVAGELGCVDTHLNAGAPKAVSGVYAGR